MQLARLASPGVERGGHDTRIGAYAVLIDDRERMLLALWNEPATPTWTLPGAGTEGNETPQQTAVRELREETG